MAKTEIYLTCYGQVFKVYSRHYMFSYQLTIEQCTKLQSSFDALCIPYKTELNFLDLDSGYESVPVNGSANSRVVFTLEEEEFHVLNFNGYLIKSYYAVMIAKAFSNKNVSSRTEGSTKIKNYDNNRLTTSGTRGRTEESNTNENSSEIKVALDQTLDQTKLISLSPQKYEQVSLFCGASLLVK